MQIPTSPRKPKRPSEAQRTASEPGVSAWVSANAGSGKTSVLVDRVVRLLLTGADPARILCLTYTKAASANMQNRIFDQLGGWVALPDADLAEELAALTGGPVSTDGLKGARRLFARAVETPGGLKIQTIHAFCERLLHLFPFEAGAPARFEMMDDAQTTAALSRALSITIRRALAASADTPAALALRTVSLAAGEDGVRDAIKAFVTHLRTAGGLELKLAGSPLRSALGVSHNDGAADAQAEILNHGLSEADLAEVVAWLKGGKPADVGRATKIVAGQTARPPNMTIYAGAFLTKDHEMTAAVATKDIAAKRPDLVDWMLNEQERVYKAVQHWKSVVAAERTEAVSLLAGEVLRFYAGEKRRLGRLDFADLIAKARDLLQSDQSRWVLYKLDQGVDHILVDEAQDTSPEQWDIVRAMAGEFFAGEGVRGLSHRTVFAVGDEKQSIFSFQGAQPEAFDGARRHFDQRIAARNTTTTDIHDFKRVPLLTSYRTTWDVLSAVDQIFLPPENHMGLESEPKRTVHDTIRRGEPGFVELWPPEEKAQKADPDPMAPVDALPPDSPEKRLADRIARRIRHWLDSESRLASSGKLISPGDILVLVRNRNAIFQETIKALKRSDVPAAGADRMKLLDQIAVQDLMSLGHVCLLPENDLALAEVLRSPLIAFDDGQLERLATKREGMSLFARLTALAETDTACARALSALTRWRDLAIASDPLRFYGMVLSGGGRARLIGRLGPDAADAIDVFLYRLRRWQAANPPSLQLFLDAMSGDESDVKRDMEEAHGRVRVMTVHASKGLEAPIVFLADTHHKPGGKPPKLFTLAANNPATAVWAPRTHDDAPAMDAARARWLASESAEHRRLLYVGLTRARDRLYVCGALRGKLNAEHWRGMIDMALTGHAHLREAPDEAGDGVVQQWRATDAKARPPEAKPRPDAPPLLFPWLSSWYSPEPVRRPPLRPSRLSEAAEPPLLREVAGRKSASRMRGDLIHVLLQRLPEVSQDRRLAVGLALATVNGGGLTEAERAEAVETSMQLMDDPHWSSLFSGEARTEVDIAGQIRVAGRMEDVSGRIDRLLIGPERVVVLDYKTGRPPDDLRAAPLGHLRQMAAYRALAQDLYPDRRVEAAILWTAVPAVTVLDPAELNAALARLA